MPEVKILKKKSYLAMIRNAAKGENNMFRNLYALVDGQEQDILQNGQVSCAVFVSSVLAFSGMLDRPHATVQGTEKAMAQAGWTEVANLREGAVITWEPITYEDGETHWHIGFYVGNDRDRKSP